MSECKAQEPMDKAGDERILEGYAFVDLFAGIGGFRLALESLGAECVYSNEWNTRAQDVYERNFGERPEGDITKVDEKTIPAHDIVCAGFPCQAFSVSGKRLGFADTRGTLFFDVARIAREHRPKVVFMENVKNFMSHDGGNTLAVVKSTMEELGYTFDCQLINATEYGAATSRERCYMVCFRKDLGIKAFRFPEPTGGTKHVQDILIADDDPVYGEVISTMYRDVDWDPVHPEPETTVDRPWIVGREGVDRQGYRIYSIKGTAITLSAHGGGRFSRTGGYLIGGRPRKLHPRECARVMGFPDSFQIDESRWGAYTQFGNSVVVDVLRIIAREIGLELANAEL